MPGRPLGWPLLVALVLSTAGASGAPPDEVDEADAPATDPPPADARTADVSKADVLAAPDPEALRPRAPAPGWDVGVMAGVCGVGTSSVWQGTEFCGALMVDVLWLRQTRRNVGLGAYALTGTAGFYDFRASVGAQMHVPLGQVLAAGLRAGPLLHVMGDALAAGWTLQAELGVRALNQSGHYTLTHTLVLGWDQSFGSGSRVGSALTIALRVDGFWLAAPLGMLF